MSEATNLCCVKCNSILDRATFQGLEVDLCPKCGGLWLDRGEITRAAKLPETELARLRGLLTGPEGSPARSDGERRALPGVPRQPVRGHARQRARRLLQQVPRHLPRPRRAGRSRRGRPRASRARRLRTRSSSPSRPPPTNTPLARFHFGGGGGRGASAPQYLKGWKRRPQTIRCGRLHFGSEAPRPPPLLALHLGSAP